MNVINHNLIAMNSQRMLGMNTQKKAKSTEKLSSGYKINRAADDAAGLAISEKMRKMIRGLNQGTENAQDGISWIQIGDGSLEEVHSMLHRMTELTVQSLNGTWSESDRVAMQAEFKQLQTEINRTTDQSKFNDQHIFAKHGSPYHQLDGNIHWLADQKHKITEDMNDLVITYRALGRSDPITATISVPPGTYTTRELVDEIDTALENAGLKEQGLVFDYSDRGFCSLTLEGGSGIHEAGGGLSYLLYDTYEGGSTGALIGTTQFFSDTAKLPIVDGQNDTLEFDIEKLDGSSIHKNIKIQEGEYNRDELIELLNKELEDTSVVAIKYGRSIKLTSDDSIITGLKGNMFKVDDPDKAVFTSVFYDNIGYETVTTIAASLTGGAVLSPPITSYNPQYYNREHVTYNINASNNELIVKPNGKDTAVTIKLLSDSELNSKQTFSFDAQQMANLLNQRFADNGLSSELYASTRSDRRGLVITSKVKGIESDIGIDTSSSAYNTLFVTRSYNQLEERAVQHRDNTNPQASYTGGKLFYTDTWPLTVTADDNDKFVMTVNGNAHEITLAEGDYLTQDELVKAINDGITARITELQKDPANEAAVKALQSVTARFQNNQVQLISANPDVCTITASAALNADQTVNAGYKDIFTTTVTFNTQSIDRYGSATLNTVVDIPAKINKNKQLFRVTLNGANTNIYFTPPNNEFSDYDTLLKYINDRLPQAKPSDMTPNKFTAVNVTGKNQSVTYNTLVPGNTTYPSAKTYSATGTGGTQGGVFDDPNAQPAEIIMPLSRLSSGLKITDSNRTITLKINNQTEEIQFDVGDTITTSNIVSKLQTKLDEKFKGNNAATVSLKGGQLAISTTKKGVLASIECNMNQAESMFLMEANATKTASYITSQNLLKSSIKIDGSNNTFKFSYNGTDVEITGLDGTYSPTTLCTKINQKIDELNAAGANINVRASADYRSSYGYALRLTSTVVGDKNEKIEFKGGTALTSMFQNSENAPATATLNCDMQKDIVIDSTNNEFKIKINGTEKTVSAIPAKTYTRAEFAKYLNGNLSDVDVTLTGNRLTFTTTATGTAAKIEISYDTMGSCAKAVFGESETKHPGLKAEFTSDHRLLLTAIDTNGNKDTTARIQVSSTTGSIFQTPTENPPQERPGVANAASNTYSYIDGASLKGSTVNINQWNNRLQFEYHYADTSQIPPVSTYRTINIALQEKEYTYDELKTALETLLNPNGISDYAKLTVDVDANGVKIQAAKPGSLCYFSVTQSNAGGFYHNVLCRAPKQHENTTPTEIKGGYEGDVYAVGRKDIRNSITEIEHDVNDILTFKLTYGNKEENFVLTLDPGRYDGATLISHIQGKLNEQLVKKGLAANTIVANIGGVDTGVIGSNDHNALVFSLSKNVKLPVADVEYKIDSIGGNASFSVFYETDGDIKVAYVTGTKDISNGVTISKDSDLSFDTDGQHYSITVPAGKYTAQSILVELNKQFKLANAPVMAKLEGNNLKLSQTKYGKHKISNISGDAKRLLFYQENSGSEEQKINILPSDRANDVITIEKPPVNTTSLGLNTAIITKQKNAAKALERLNGAVAYVSEVRGMFGATQNRLEHTINSNKNTAENLQASESIIRDTDISHEAIEMSKSNILDQIGQLILTQANQSKQGVMRLLQ